jgi:hypothetical protein
LDVEGAVAKAMGMLSHHGLNRPQNAITRARGYLDGQESAIRECGGLNENDRIVHVALRPREAPVIVAGFQQHEHPVGHLGKIERLTTDDVA